MKQIIAGESFGESALFVDKPREATVISDDDNTICLALGRDKINEILGDNLQQIIFNNMVRWQI